MAIEVKHATQAVGTDAGNGEIRKTQWNEAHTITLAASRLLGRYAATAGAAQEITLGSGFSLNTSTGVMTFSESDPIFTAHVAYSITSTNISNWNTAYGWGNHASAGYLTSGAIGVSVQAYDADLTSWAAIAPSAKQDTLVSATNIKTINGASVLGSGNLTVSDAVYTITDGASVDINPANGGVQMWTLGANRTPTATSFASGQSVTLMIADGTAYAVTWSTIGVVWTGGTAPTLPTSGYGVIELWKSGSTVYGAYVGAVA